MTFNGAYQQSRDIRETTAGWLEFGVCQRWRELTAGLVQTKLVESATTWSVPCNTGAGNCRYEALLFIVSRKTLSDACIDGVLRSCRRIIPLGFLLDVEIAFEDPVEMIDDETDLRPVVRAGGCCFG